MKTDPCYILTCFSKKSVILVQANIKIYAVD